MNFKMAIVLFAVIIGLLVLSIVGFVIYKFFTYRTDTALVKDFVITDQWKEIKVKSLVPPLTRDRNTIYIAAPPSFDAFDFDRGIVAPDGTAIEPEVEAIDTNGKTHFFKRTAARRGPEYEMAGYNPYPELQKGVQIDSIRIRSNHELRVPVILWSTYDIKDLP